MLIPSVARIGSFLIPSLSRRVNANTQLSIRHMDTSTKLIKKGEC